LKNLHEKYFTAALAGIWIVTIIIILENQTIYDLWINNVNIGTSIRIILMSITVFRFIEMYLKIKKK